MTSCRADDQAPFSAVWSIDEMNNTCFIVGDKNGLRLGSCCQSRPAA